MITLASDFGTPYPAVMKGVLCQRTDARLIDVAHDLPRQDVQTAAFWLRETLPYFPPAVHLVVVDPGVGTDRRGLVIRADEHVLVGPDNGVLLPVAERLTDGGTTSAFVIDEERVDQPAVGGRSESTTFHGRDVFAPIAAAAHAVRPADLDSLEVLTSIDLDELVRGELPRARVDGDVAYGSVLAVDDFGNVITNVSGRFLETVDAVRVDGQYVPVGETFASVDAGERLVVVGSHGFVELDVNSGRGDEAFDLTPGSSVELERIEVTPR